MQIGDWEKLNHLFRRKENEALVSIFVLELVNLAGNFVTQSGFKTETIKLAIQTIIMLSQELRQKTLYKYKYKYLSCIL